MRVFAVIVLMLASYGCNSSTFTGRSKSGDKKAPPEDSAGADGGASSPDKNDGADGSEGIRVDPESDNGAPVQTTRLKLGINFEDKGLLGDRDYNDDVLCFEGKFEVTKATGVIKSTVDQQVVGSINRNADCAQRITITIRHPDGTQQVIAREPLQRVLMQETLVFKAQSTLDVVFQALNDKCDVKQHRVTEPDFVMFGFDVCNI